VTRETHIDPQTLAAFAEGRQERASMPEVLAHVEVCPSCYAALAAAVDSLPEPASSPRRVWILAAAAAIVVVLFGTAILRQRAGSASAIDRLVALSPRDARLLEPRLSGGFAWAAYRGPMRSEAVRKDTKLLKLSGAAAEVIEAGESEHAVGVAHLLIDDSLEAVERLRAASAHAPNDATILSDLGAAQYSAAAQLGRASLYPEALASAERALRTDPRLPEALFNRALVLERMGLTDAAREAWQRYLDVDGSSPWANEARARLAKLPSTTSEKSFRNELPRLEKAAAANDAATVAALVASDPQLGRAYGEAFYLGRWGASSDTNALTAARMIGAALERQSGESLLAEAVATIDHANASERVVLAEAHAAFDRGRRTQSRMQPAEAERDLRRATELFTRTHSPMALVARYHAAIARFDQHDLATARRELRDIHAQVPPHHYALDAQIRWQLALGSMVDGDWSGALPVLEAAADSFTRLGERSNQAFVLMLAADTLAALGRPDESWSTRMRALAIESAEGRAERLAIALGSAARTELRNGRREVAGALMELEAAALRTGSNEPLLTDALVRQAVLSEELGEHDAALRHVREASESAQRLTDNALRERAHADVQFASGAIALREDAGRARELLTSAIEQYRASQLPLFLPESHLLRARADMQLANHNAAADDLEAGIVAIERHRLRFAGPVEGTGVLDAGTLLFEEAVRAALDRNDPATAFAYSERGRLMPSSRVSVNDLQARLRGTRTAVLKIAALPTEIVVFCATGEDFLVARRPISRAKLAELASGEDEISMSALYQLLVQPVAASLAGASELIVIADPPLENVPFSALYDAASKTCLVERMSVAMALSASSLEIARLPARRHTLAALALPAGEASAMAGLPQMQQELADVARLYDRVVEVSADRAKLETFLDAASSADVVHIAGHTTRVAGPGETALVFGPGERVSWKSIATTPLPSSVRVVVLAACESLRAPQSPHVRALSLGAGFLAAGAGDVIGTLAPISDVDAREMFVMVHRELAAGAGAAVAVRRAQLEARQLGLAWRTIALVTRHIPAAD
jgi:tetratricopeptide (TPR) repeat protein